MSHHSRWVPGWILVIASRNHQDHALPSPRQQDSVGVLQIFLPLACADVLPGVAPKRPVLPALPREAKICIPHYTRPVQFQALDMELGDHIFQIVGRADIVLLVEKPVHGIDWSLTSSAWSFSRS